MHMGPTLISPDSKKDQITAAACKLPSSAMPTHTKKYCATQLTVFCWEALGDIIYRQIKAFVKPTK